MRDGGRYENGGGQYFGIKKFTGCCSILSQRVLAFVAKKLSTVREVKTEVQKFNLDAVKFTGTKSTKVQGNWREHAYSGFRGFSVEKGREAIVLQRHHSKNGTMRWKS